MLDPNGNPVFQSADGTPLVDSSGDSIIGRDGRITQDADGNPVAINPDGTIQTDANGNPIFLDGAGNPIVDSDGNSTRGADGLPLEDADGEDIEAVVYTPNGTVVTPEDAGGTFVFDRDGNVLLDANGNPVVVPEGGKAPPTNGTAGGVFGVNATLPDGSPASGLQVRVRAGVCAGVCAVAVVLCAAVLLWLRCAGSFQLGGTCVQGVLQFNADSTFVISPCVRRVVPRRLL